MFGLWISSYKIFKCRNHLVQRRWVITMKAYQAPSSPIWNELNTRNVWQKERSSRCRKTQTLWKVICTRVILFDNCITVYITAMWVICLTYYPNDIILCSWRIYPMALEYWGSTYDDVPYKYPQIEKMVKDFTEVTLAPLWRIVIFHSMGQALSVTIALKSRCIGKHSVTIYLICGIYVAYNIFINVFWNNCEIGLKWT